MTRPVYNPACFLATHGRWEGRGLMPSCVGPLRRVHLLPKQLLKRTLGCDGSDPRLWDPAVWVLGCGGYGGGGAGGHHGALDLARTLRLPREALPHSLLAYAESHGLTWYVDRNYRSSRG